MGDSLALVMAFLIVFGFALLVVGYMFLTHWMDKKNISTSALNKTIIGIPAIAIGIPLIALVLLVPVLREIVFGIVFAVVMMILAILNTD